MGSSPQRTDEVAYGFLSITILGQGKKNLYGFVSKRDKFFNILDNLIIKFTLPIF